MPALPSNTAPRLPRARWLNPRLLLGVLLVAASVVAGSRVVAAADETVPVWVLTRDLGPASRLAPGDLVVRRVTLEAGIDRYVSAAGPPPLGRSLDRAVGTGELLPRAALAPGDVDLRRVSVATERTAQLARGSVVDVFRVPAPISGRSTEASRLVLRAVTVGDVVDAGRTVGTPGRRDVVLLVPAGEVGKILDATVGARVELVAVTGTDNAT